MTKEEKQEFISKYIESITVEKNESCHNGIKIKDLKFKSLYTEKINRLTELALAEFFLPIELDGKVTKLQIAESLKESQVKKYLKEFDEYGGVNFYIHPTFNYSLDEMPYETLSFDIPKDEEVLKMVPIINEEDDPKDVTNRFRLGVVTTRVKTFKEDFKE